MARKKKRKKRTVSQDLESLDLQEHVRRGDMKTKDPATGKVSVRSTRKGTEIKTSSGVLGKTVKKILKATKKVSPNKAIGKTNTSGLEERKRAGLRRKKRSK